MIDFLESAGTVTPRELVEQIEKEIKTREQLKIRTNHYFAGGVYEREIVVPVGALITGKIHLTEHLAKLVYGQMSIFSDDVCATFQGPISFVSKPGVKRLGFARTDCVFSTFHAVGAMTDVEEIEKLLVVDTQAEFLKALGLSFEHQEAFGDSAAAVSISAEVQGE